MSVCRRESKCDASLILKFKSLYLFLCSAFFLLLWAIWFITLPATKCLLTMSLSEYFGERIEIYIQIHHSINCFKWHGINQTLRTASAPINFILFNFCAHRQPSVAATIIIQLEILAKLFDMFFIRWFLLSVC